MAPETASPEVEAKAAGRGGKPPATEPAVGGPSPADAEADAAAARRMLDAALEPLREPTDPRAAVIEAYARMEQVLASREPAGGSLRRRASTSPECCASRECPSAR